MADQRTIADYYAILIGINAYRDRPLKGCVRDVRNIKKCLEGASNHVRIQMYTTNENVDPESSPTEDPMLWPTYQNVISALGKITSSTKSGDFVYIHYSGHGTRAEPEGQFSNRSTGDLALVLLDGGNAGNVRYLYGNILARFLDAMVEKGLVVTLVLDCCFSGSVYRRDDHNVRYLPYDAEIDSKYPMELDMILGDDTGYPASRDASMRSNWLINPDGYAILAACGPHEEATELKLEDGQTHGALSYFLLTSIDSGGLGKKRKDIYEHLRGKFRGSQPQQTPVLYGNKDQGFFGYANPEVVTGVIHIVAKQDGGLELLAGQAHDVGDCDLFAVHSLSSGKHDSISKRDPVVAKVVQARALTSDLELVEPTPIPLHAEWVATALTRFSLKKLPIRLASGLPRRNELMTALKGRMLDVRDDDDEHFFSFHVMLNSIQEYEIQDESGQRTINVPTMMQDQTDVDRICDVVEHLAKFRRVRDLANNVPADSFRESFSVRITNSTGETFSPGCLAEVDDGTKFTLVVENKGENPLYAYVYNMGSRWQMQNILKGTYEVIPSRHRDPTFAGIFEKKVKTKIPPEMKERGVRQCKDIIKIFVTSRPTSFDFLELPKLGEPRLDKPIKSSAADRTDQKDGHSSENWVALNFLIQTSLK